MAVVVTVVVAGWWLTSADAVTDWSGWPNATSQVGMGESMYVGFAGLADRPVVATSLSPVATSGLQTSLFTCEPASAQADLVGIVDRATIDDYCELAPVRGRTVLEADPLAGYLVVEVTRTEAGPQRLCGVHLR